MNPSLLLPIFLLLGAPPAIKPSAPGAVPAAEVQESSAPTSLAEATEAARKAGKERIFFFLYARDCGDCQRMDVLIRPARAFQDYVANKLVVELDMDTPGGAEVAARFGIQAPPAWVVITPEGVLSWVQSGMLPQSKWFDALLESERSWAHYQVMLRKEAEEPKNGALIFENAVETFKRRGDALAEPRFRKVIDDRTAPAEAREKALAYLATIEMDADKVEEARGHLEQLLSTVKDPALRERAELRMAEAEIGLGRNESALRRLEGFRKAYPESKSLSQADQMKRYVESILAGARKN